LKATVSKTVIGASLSRVQISPSPPNVSARQGCSRALGGLIAALGLALAIALPALPGAIAGFALVGIGTAVLVPLTFSAGANLGASGTALTLVMASGYAGAIAGPAMIGGAADQVGLRIALGIPLAAAIVVVALARNLQARPKRANPQPSRR
jgi:MFS family permease